MSHELAVGSPGGPQVLVALVELQTQVSGLLFQRDDVLFELVDVVGCAEPGLAPGLLAECFGQALFELLDAGSQAGGALLGVEQVGLQRCPADRRPGGCGSWLGFCGVELFE